MRRRLLLMRVCVPAGVTVDALTIARCPTCVVECVAGGDDREAAVGAVVGQS